MSFWRRDAGWLRRCYPLTDPSLERDLAICRDIASRSKANLLHAAHLLPRQRQQFFFISYAAMRLIDDQVDDDFLMRPATERAEMRADMLAAIDRWEAQCLGTAEEGPLPAPVRRAMQAIVQPSDLGDGPWRGLADAMRRDAKERPMRDWQDFLGYAAGATVAPATIFIYLLSATPTPEGFRACLPEPPEYYAEDLGIFCYLVHILRDLSKDAERSERLVTIPVDMIQNAGLEKTGLTEALRMRDRRITVLASTLRDRAADHLAEGLLRLDALKAPLGTREYFALKGLIGIYRKLFERFTGDFFDALSAAPALETTLRKELLTQAERAE